MKVSDRPASTRPFSLSSTRLSASILHALQLPSSIYQGANSPSLFLSLVHNPLQLPLPLRVLLDVLVLRDLLDEVEPLVEMPKLVSVGGEVEFEGLLDAGEGARDGEEVDGSRGGKEAV